MQDQERLLRPWQQHSCGLRLDNGSTRAVGQGRDVERSFMLSLVVPD